MIQSYIIAARNIDGLFQPRTAERHRNHRDQTSPYFRWAVPTWLLRRCKMVVVLSVAGLTEEEVLVL